MVLIRLGTVCTLFATLLAGPLFAASDTDMEQMKREMEDLKKQLRSVTAVATHEPVESNVDRCLSCKCEAPPVVTTGIGNFVTFSEIDFNFRVTPQIMALGVVFAMVLGALGGLFPASSASRKEILTALRGV